MASGTLSDLLGWTSIACWLFAQFPQVLENAKRRSCEGLALPFLLNWLLGDITNLIGCLLTHQLPFQTILAAYFVSVDFTLFSQYFYYKLLTPKTHSPKLLESTTPTLRYGHGRRTSTDHEHFRELSHAAANVAFAAAVAAEEEELHSHESHGRPALGTSMTRSEAAEAEDAVDEATLSALADSFHSESGRKHVSWSQERYGHGRGGSTSRTRARPPLSPLTTVRSSFISPSPTVETGNELPPHYAGAPGEFDASIRGRPRQRQVVDSPMGDEDLEVQQESALTRTVSQDTIKDRRNSRASSKAAGLVFLSAWALFGVGTLANSQRNPTNNFLKNSSPSRGLVLSDLHVSSAAVVVTTVPSLHAPSASYDFTIDSALEAPSFPSPDQPEYQQEPEEPEESDPPSSERILGRISAWACTTLYLTSRLPQIWKNFVRRSVEGLSIYLFIFAFLGNTFYVLSILSSPMMSLPAPEATAFLKESIPYLLGSGGTLLFDVTIVIQSVIYRPNPKFGHRRTRTLSTSHSRSRTNSHAVLPGSYQTTVGRGTSSLSRRGRSLSTTRISSVYARSRSTSLLASEQAPLLSPKKIAETHDIERGYEHGYTQSRRRKDASESENVQGVSE